MLLERAVAHRLRTVDAPAIIAVVSTPRNVSRSYVAANLALALADGETPVLAVDGHDGTMASKLCPGVQIGPTPHPASRP